MHASAHVWEVRPRLSPPPFDALLNGQRLYTVVSLRPPLHALYIALPYRQGPCSTAPPPVHQRHPPYPSRPHQWTIRALTTHASRPLRAEPKLRRLHPSLHHVISIHVPISPHLASPPTRFGSSNPSPPSHDASPAAPPASPQAFAFGAHELQYVFEAVQTHAKYARCVQLAGRVRNAHHVMPTSILVHTPSRAITILRPKPSPHAGPVPFLRASGSSVIASSTPPHVTHDPRTSPRLPNGDSTPFRAILRLRNVFPCCRHSAQSPLSPCFRRLRRQPPRDTAP
ncbi:hypothetical protein B0H14DRAFT_71086 [Mycena olivaceomarginata]|nr:hypothetical protein B0H14DRAFT_71086 [Mycena olivaceomarginata]